VRSLLRDIARIVRREGRARRDRGDAVELPAASDQTGGARSAARRRRELPDGAGDPAVARIEERGPALGAQIEGVLGDVIFTGDEPGRGAGHVHGRDVVERLGKPIGRAECKPPAVIAGKRRLQRMVGGVRVVREQADGGERTLSVSAAAGVDAARVHRAGRVARPVDAWVGLDEAGQPGSLRAGVADLKRHLRGQGALDGEIPVLRIRRPGGSVLGQHCCRAWKEVRTEGTGSAPPRVGIAEGWAAELHGLKPGQSADGRLHRHAGAV